MKFLFPKKIINENLSEWLVFENPIKIFSIYENSKNFLEEIYSFFDFLQKNQKYYYCGFFSYQFGEILNIIPKTINQKKLLELPIIYGGCFSDFRLLTLNLEDLKIESYIKDLIPLESFKNYKKKILYIKHFIKKGMVYQINYTFPIELSIFGNLENLFFLLWQNQKSLNSGLLLDENFFVLSNSLELFFEINNLEIKVKPMKGTISKSRSLRENISKVKYLKSNPKEKAENAMIVDLIRNDLGKISTIGSIKLEKSFSIEIYPTIIQMVSIIKAKLKKNCREKVFWESIFPSGSVTGVPKISAMKFIKKLESYARGIYTGSIGYITPENDAKFNVAIRTIYGNSSKSYYFVGSGITIDSQPLKEYKECLIKSGFIQKTRQLMVPQYIFTTMKFSGGIIYFKKSHISRLNETKNFFSYDIPETKICNKVNRIEYLLKKAQKPLRIHFRIYLSGKIQIFLNYLNPKEKIKFMISSKRVRSDNIFLFYKTSHRDLYNEELEIAKQLGYNEIIFLNENEHLTEGSFTNIILKIEGNYYTPKHQNGLLKGNFLKKIIKKLNIEEVNLNLSDLQKCEQIYFVNSVRGFIRGDLNSIFLHQ